MKRLCFILLTISLMVAEPAKRITTATATRTPGLVAFWDFVKRELDDAQRIIAHVPAGEKTDYPLDAANYIKDYLGAGREATYADFPLLGRGRFGQAIRIRKEEDKTFRPFLFVSRERLHDSPIDIKGGGGEKLVACGHDTSPDLSQHIFHQGRVTLSRTNRFVTPLPAGTVTLICCVTPLSL